MTLEQLLTGFSVKKGNLSQREVSSVCFDSRKIQENCVFIAIRGEKSDGHAFLYEAFEKGAMALVVEDESRVPTCFQGAVVQVGDSRAALNRLAARFFGEPSRHLFSVGVTGTNGKTTTTYMVESLLNKYNLQTGVVGTINHHLGSRVWKTEMTTPDPVSFQKRLQEFIAFGAKAVALEVSSHALRQCRVDEVAFDVAVFTNLSRDHLDYHSDMEDYFDAKKKLFAELLPRSTKSCPTAVINIDDEYGQRLWSEMCAHAATGRVRVWSYGLSEDADLRIRVLQQGFEGTRFILRAHGVEKEIRVPMAGLHNVYNAVGAIGAGLAAGLSLEACASALADFTGVSGRLQSVQNKRNLHIFIDYAHTDDALTTVLRYLGGIRSVSGLKNRIITVFGCGGDRDKGKRPLMMRAAVAASDLVLVTSDNPRTEDPEAIIRDALAGIDPALIGKQVFQRTDRREGIRQAIEMAQAGDVVLIAGKGHEDYQQIGTTKYPFSDAAVVAEILAE